jgi:AAA15 family ATPase/GTPase
MQVLTVEGFLGIRSAKVHLDGLTVLIGAQASGKSVIARLFYFFNEYFADFDELALLKNEHKKTYDARKKQDFCRIFPNYSWESDEFVISFHTGAHFIEIKSAAGSSSIDLQTSKSVSDYFRSIKKSFQDFSKGFAERGIPTQTRMLREFRMINKTHSGEKHERSLFVPAARSFYSTIREEIFSILSIDEKIDRILMQFGDFYESAKASVRYDDSNRRTPGRQERTPSAELRYFASVLKGHYVRADERDWIDMERGRIELSKASSGQQEALPLLLALSRFPAPGRTLIIEEPEAHLFPESQVEVLDFIVRQTVTRETNILITTHSPYLLASLNNYILRGLNGAGKSISSDRVYAYSLQKGRSQSIKDKETKLISADYIDSISEVITSEFISILESTDD